MFGCTMRQLKYLTLISYHLIQNQDNCLGLFLQRNSYIKMRMYLLFIGELLIHNLYFYYFWLCQNAFFSYSLFSANEIYLSHSDNTYDGGPMFLSLVFIIVLLTSRRNGFLTICRRFNLRL